MSLLWAFIFFMCERAGCAIPEILSDLRVTWFPESQGEDPSRMGRMFLLALFLVPHGVRWWISQLGHPHGDRLRAQMSQLGLRCPFSSVDPPS